MCSFLPLLFVTDPISPWLNDSLCNLFLFYTEMLPSAKKKKLKQTTLPYNANAKTVFFVLLCRDKEVESKYFLVKFNSNRIQKCLSPFEVISQIVR